jgi:hypothetical protein
MRDGAGCDECVVCSRSRLAPRRAQCCRYAAKCSGAVSIERKYVKVRLGLLEVLLAGTALGIVARDVRTYGKLGQRYRANHRFVGKLGRVGYLA